MQYAFLVYAKIVRGVNEIYVQFPALALAETTLYRNDRFPPQHQEAP